MAIDDQVDLMTEEEMDLETDPEFQDILKQLGAGEAQALMQLIKEYKEMVAQGFQGEFEDFVKVKMATAQNDDDVEFQSEDEMIIEPDEMMDIEKQIVPTEMAAEGGRIDPPKLGNPPVFEKIEDMREWRIANPDVEDVADYKGYYERLKNPEDYDEHGWKKKRKKKQEGGIMDVVEDEEVVETGPTRQEMIMDYLRQRGLPITPENIQRAIIEMITGGMPYTEEAAYDMPQMEQPSVLPRGMMVDETIIDRTPRGIATLTEDVMTPPAKPYLYDALIDDQPWDTQQSTMFAAHGGRAGFEEGGPVTDEEKYDEYKSAKEAAGEEYLDFDTFKLFKIQFGSFPMAAGGRVPYGLGSLVKKIFKPIKKVGSKLVKSVKKFAKSDLGKAALMYMATAGAANIMQPGAASWASPFTKGAGTGWLRPDTVLGNLGKSYTGLKEAFTSPASKAITNSGTGVIEAATADALPVKSLVKNYVAPKEGILTKLATSFKENPMPWIIGSSLAGGAYTAANPGEENLDRLMADRNKEVADWDNIMANIRSGQTVTPFTTGNVMFPYPNYYLNVAEGGRIGRAEGGIMDLGGMEKDYRETGGFVPIGEYEKKDDVPARLSLNEFVMTADAVRGAGNGDVDKGAEVMEDMMETLEAKGRRHRQAQDMFSVSERLSEVVN